MKPHFRLFLALTSLALVASGPSGCGLSSAPAPTPVPPAATQLPPTSTPGLVGTAPPTATPSPTEAPTSTPAPSATPTPEPTPTATPAPTATATPAPPPSQAAPGQTWTRPADGMAMLYIPAAEFEMGSSEAQIDAALAACERDRGDGRCEREWFEDEAPPHKVTLDAYWIDRTEVTNAGYAAFLNAQGNQVEGGVAWLETEDEKSLIEEVDGEYRTEAGYADHPVIKVSWHGAVAYCDWVGGELPTEAMWEYAARGPEGHTYPWGDEAQSPTCTLANAAGCQGGTLPVGSLPEGASWSGAHDMAGNVWEWVYNWYLPYPDSQHENEDFGRMFKVVRGGSWKFEPYYVRAAQRNLEYMPDVRSDQIGFRCVISVEE